jgi:hypothetical protein
MKAPWLISLVVACVTIVVPVRSLAAQDSAQKPAEEETKVAASAAAAAKDLEKAAQNPVAALISVPVQNNSNFAIGPYDRTQDVLNIQPVIPLKLSENWNLINASFSQSCGSRILRRRREANTVSEI